MNKSQKRLALFKIIVYNPVFDSCTYKNPSKILIYSALFEGLFA